MAKVKFYVERTTTAVVEVDTNIPMNEVQNFTVPQFCEFAKAHDLYNKADWSTKETHYRCFAAQPVNE